MTQLQTTGWIFTPPPCRPGVDVPVRAEEAETLQRLCPAVRLSLGPSGVWSIGAEDSEDLSEIRAFILARIEAQATSDAWRLRSVAYRLLDAEGF